MTDYSNPREKQTYNGYYDDVVVESFEGPLEGSRVGKIHEVHDSYCVLSAFLYFITITTFAYLFVLWIRHRMHTRMEQMYWW